MKAGIYIIAILLVILHSCTTNMKKEDAPVSTSDDYYAAADPNVFIGNHKTQVMVLGVFHFSNSSSDTYKSKFSFNILEEKRQEELDHLLDKIAAYNPTKILLEWNRITDDSLTNIEYQNYIQNKFDINEKSNEVYQIGFKLGKKLNHERVYCTDARKVWYGVELDWDNYDFEGYVKSKNQYEKIIRYDDEQFYRLGDSLKSVRHLTEHLIWLNEPSNRLKSHQGYLSSMIEGAGDNYLGADNVGSQYSRNLRIFANAYDITNFDQEERLLLVYGASHVWQLRHLFMDSPDFQYIEANTYLKPK